MINILIALVALLAVVTLVQITRVSELLGELKTQDVNTDTELSVSDDGTVDLKPLVGSEIAVINYLSNGKYKKQIWQKVGSTENHEALQAEFEKSVEAGYPKDFIGYTEEVEVVEDLKAEMLKSAKDTSNKTDGLPF